MYRILPKINIKTNWNIYDKEKNYNKFCLIKFYCFVQTSSHMSIAYTNKLFKSASYIILSVRLIYSMIYHWYGTVINIIFTIGNIILDTMDMKRFQYLRPHSYGVFAEGGFMWSRYYLLIYNNFYWPM